jgi:hypothetical protein
VETFSVGSLPPGQDLNPGPSEYHAEVECGDCKICLADFSVHLHLGHIHV